MKNALKIRKAEMKLSKSYTNNVLHLLLSLITAWLWVPVWILVGISNSMEQARLNRLITKLYNQ